MRSWNQPGSGNRVANRRGPQRRRTRRARLGLFETLEERRLLTLWTVTSLDDVVAQDGKLTLREAIIAASENRIVNEATPAGTDNGLDEIRFASHLFDNGPAFITITPGSASQNRGPLAIGTTPIGTAGPVSIVGPGRDEAGNWLLTLDGNHQTGIATVRTEVSISGIAFQGSNVSAITNYQGASANLELEDAAFRDNRGTDGGAIRFVYGELSIRNSVFEGNEATGNGGAIYLEEPNFSTGQIRNVTAVLRDVTLTNNSAGGAGGAIDNQGGELNLFDVSVANNRATGHGGGIASFGASTTKIYDTSVTGNRSGFDGGGIYHQDASGLDLTIGNSVVDSNSAAGNGGGVALVGGDPHITETTISNNVARFGGGVSNDAGRLTVERSTLAANVSVEGGGGLFTRGSNGRATMVNTTISGNYAQGAGGGILQDDGRLLLTNVTLVLNRSDADNDGNGAGGGLSVDGLQASETASDTQLFNTIVAGNIQGQGFRALVDNSNLFTYTETGSWTSLTDNGLLGNAQVSNAGDGSRKATWTFAGLDPGKYRVLVTWPESTAAATNAPFSVKDATRTLGTTTINQQNSPLAHAIQNGTDFQSLGGFTITTGTLTVELTNEADGDVIADAVRIERVDEEIAAIDPLTTPVLSDIVVAKSGATINADRSWHNLIGDPQTAGGLEDDPQDVANNNFVGNFGSPWDINRIIFTELSDNLGGATAVHALKADSPAIDEGSPFLLSAKDGIPYINDEPYADFRLDGTLIPYPDAITSDQRGYPFLRADDQSGNSLGDFPVDIGAYELQLRPLLRSQEIVVSALGTARDGNYADGELTFMEAIEIANLRTDKSTIRFSNSLQQYFSTLDNTSASRYVETGDWEDLPNGYAGSSRTPDPTSSGQSAVWEFTHLEPGEYRVMATWPESDANTTNAQFTVHGGDEASVDFSINQQQAPRADAVEKGRIFETLGRYTVTSSGNLEIQLTNNAGGTLVADAVRIERVELKPAEIDLGGAVIDVLWDLYISGAGTTIRNGDIKIEPFANMTFDGVTIRGGGRIENFGNTIIKNSDISGLNRGGVINKGTMEIHSSRLHDNDNTNSRGGSNLAGGGAINNYETMLIGPDVIVMGNRGDYGGGIWNGNYADMTIIDSTIMDNTATRSGGGIANENSRLTIRRSNINGNTAGDGRGGGIYSWVASLSVFDTTVDGNTATKGTDVNESLPTPEDLIGGGIYAAPRSGYGLQIDRSTISNNTANRAGGAFGGGVALDPLGAWEGAIIRSSTIYSNHVTADPGSATRGGGVYVLERDPGSNTAWTLIESSTIALNRANGTIGEGGGAFIGDETLLKNVLLTDNEATSSSGADLFFRPGLDIDGPYQPYLGDTIFNPVTHTLAVATSTGSSGVFATGNSHGNLVLTSVNVSLAQQLMRQDGELTATLPLSPSSYAIDSGMREGLLDQRGFPVTDNVFTSTRPREVNGFIVRDGSGEESADIGAYESAKVAVQEFSNSITDASQFAPDGLTVIGVGYDDGKPNSKLTKEPRFFGVEFDPDPFTLGPGIESLSVFGVDTQWGGEVTADVDGRLGIEVGYYLNTGSVDTTFDGLFGYSIDDSKAGEGKYAISTGVQITDGSLYTVSPRAGAYVDLVLELNAAISGVACVAKCLGGELKINVDETTELVSLNRQLTNDDGELLFIGPDGVQTTTRQAGNRPALNGDIGFIGTDFAEIRDTIVDGVKDDLLESEIKLAGGTTGFLSQVREARTKAEQNIARANAELDRLSVDTIGADTGEVLAKIQELQEGIKEYLKEVEEAEEKEKKATKKKPDAEKVGGGAIFTVDFGKTDGVLGIEAELGVGVEVGKVGVGKKLGKLTLTVPEINLSATEPDANGKLAATTNDFVVGSDEDVKRQLAALSIDVAAFGPLGTYTVDLGPIGLEATTVSYNITPRLGFGQDVSVEPFFDDAHRAAFVFNNLSDQIRVTVGGVSITINPGDPEQQRTVGFLPGQTVEIDADPDDDNVVSTIDIAPSLTVGHRFSNDIDLEFDVVGMLEILRLKAEAFGSELFDTGALIEETHKLVDTIDLKRLFSETFTLPPTKTDLEPFSLSRENEAAPNGLTPGNTISLDSGVPKTNLEPVAADTLTYFSVPLLGPDGIPQTDVRFKSEGAMPTFIRPPYDGLTLELINVTSENGNHVDTVVSRFDIGIAGTDAFADVAGWNGEVFRLKGFENLKGGRAIFGVKLDSVPTSITAEAQGAGSLSAPNRSFPDEFAIRASELRNNLVVVDNDFAFDIDLDGTISPTTDGELVLRYMRGLTGTELIDGAVSSGAKRNSASVIQAYLDGLKAPELSALLPSTDSPLTPEQQAYREGLLHGRRLDVDNSATFDVAGNLLTDGIDPNVDGVLILRHMAGIGITIATGPALTFGETGTPLPVGLRRDPQGIADFIDGKIAPPATSKNDVLRSSVRGNSLEDKIEISPDVIVGSSPWVPIKTDFTQGQGSYLLSTFGNQAPFEDVFLQDGSNPEVLVRSGAVGTPGTTIPVPDNLKKYSQQPSSADLTGFTYRAEQSTKTIGADSLAPIFVELPDAAGYRVSLPDSGLAITHLVFDPNVGGNVYRNHTSENGGTTFDFDVYLPDTQTWLAASMETGLTLPVNVRMLEIYPRSLLNEELFFTPSQDSIDLDFAVGLVISGTPTGTPRLETTILADRQSLIALDPIGFSNSLVGESTVRVKRNGAFLDVSRNGEPTTPASSQGLTYSVAQADPATIVDDGDPGFRIVSGSWSTVSSSGSFDGDYVRKLAGDGSSTVSWTLDVVEQYDYLIAISWEASPDNASNVKFKVTDSYEENVTPIDQTQPPRPDFWENGRPFQIVEFVSNRSDFYSGSGQVVVQLSDDADAGRFVAADAVRIVRFPYAEAAFDPAVASNLSLTGLLNGFGLANHVKVVITDADGNKRTDTIGVSVTGGFGESMFVSGVASPIPDVLVPPEATQHIIDLSSVFAFPGAINAVVDNPLVSATISGEMLTLTFPPGAEAIVTVSSGFLTTDTFSLSTGNPSTAPVVATPIPDVALNFNRPFTIDLIGRYAATRDVTLSSLTSYRSDSVPAEQAKLLQLVGGQQAETLILDGTGGPLDLPFSFIRSATYGGKVQVEGSGIAIDLVNRDYLMNVPTIDLRGSGANRLTLDTSAAVRSSDMTYVTERMEFVNRMVVLADGDDIVQLNDEANWTVLNASATDNSQYPGATFKVYQTNAGTSESVELWVSNSIDAATHPAGPPPQTHAGSTLTRSLSELPPTQVVAATTSNLTVGPGQTFSVDVAYRVDGAMDGRVPPGMLVEVHYDSDFIKFNRVTNVTGAADFVPAILANSAETAELVSDGDLKTDGVVVLSWSEILGIAGQNDWPADAPASTRLITLEFTAEQFAVAGDTNINLTGEGASGFQLELNPLTLALDPTHTSAGLRLSETSATVSEAGSTATFTAVLTSRPATDVVLNISSGDTGEATVAPSTLTFTPTNWNVPRTVTVTGVADQLVDGPQTTVITVSVDTLQSDVAYHNIAAQTISVTTTDVDVPSDTLVQLSLSITDLLGNPLPDDQISVGQDFRLSLLAKDLRELPQGVFSAYLDIAYDNAAAFSVLDYETQRLTLSRDTIGGSYEISFQGVSTGAISIGTSLASASENLRQALENHPNIGSGNVRVVNTGIIDMAGTNNFAFEITFINELAEIDLPTLSVDASLLTTISGTPQGSVDVITNGGQRDSNWFPQAFDGGPFYRSRSHVGEDGDRDPSTGEILDPNVFSEVGAFSNLFSLPQGEEEQPQLVFSVDLRARQAGSVNFTGNPADQPVQSAIQLLGHLDVVSTAQVSYGTAMIQIIENSDPIIMLLSGETLVTNEGGVVFVRNAGNVLFQKSRSEVTELAFVGGAGDEVLAVGDLGLHNGQAIDISFDGQSGTDTFRLLDSAQTLDLTALASDAIVNVEIFDVVGSGQNELILDAATVRMLAPDSKRLLVRVKSGDEVSFRQDWMVDAPAFIGGETVHQQHQGDTILQVVSDRPWQNPFNQLDVNRDGTISPIDVLIGINVLNEGNAGQLDVPRSAAELPIYYLDVNGDQFISPIDVLIGINFLNTPAGSPEGEATVPRMYSTPPFPPGDPTSLDFSLLTALPTTSADSNTLLPPASGSRVESSGEPRTAPTAFSPAVSTVLESRTEAVDRSPATGWRFGTALNELSEADSWRAEPNAFDEALATEDNWLF